MFVLSMFGGCIKWYVYVVNKRYYYFFYLIFVGLYFFCIVDFFWIVLCLLEICCSFVDVIVFCNK